MIRQRTTQVISCKSCTIPKITDKWRNWREIMWKSGTGRWGNSKTWTPSGNKQTISKMLKVYLKLKKLHRGVMTLTKYVKSINMWLFLQRSHLKRAAKNSIITDIFKADIISEVHFKDKNTLEIMPIEKNLLLIICSIVNKNTEPI